MKPRIILFALFASSIFSYAQAKERFVKKQNISSGSAEILLGTVKGEEQVVQMSGTRKIAGIYPHLTASRKAAKMESFLKADIRNAGLEASSLGPITYG